MRSNKIKRFILATSSLQLIFFNIARERNSKKYEDILVIFHPLLKANTIKSIIYNAKKIGINKTINLQKEFKKYFDYHLYNFNKKKITEKYKVKELLKISKNRLSLVNKVKKKVYGNNIEFYHRNTHGTNEQVFVDTYYNNAKFFGFMDGSGDYIPLKSYILEHYLRKIITHVYRKKLTDFIKCILLKDFSLMFEKSHKNIKKQKVFDLKSKKDCKILLNNFKLIQSKKNNRNVKCIILGLPTLEYPERFYLTPEKEINIYNDIISQIKKKHKLKNSEIWFKCHPRLSTNNYKKIKKKIKCKFFNPNDLEIAETYILNENTKIIASPGSTSLIFAKYIFGKNCYYIDLQSQNMLKEGKGYSRDYERMYQNFKIFDMKIIKPLKKY